MNLGAREGDRVKVRLVSGEEIRGKVTYTPQDTGDCWVIVRDDKTFEGLIYNIQRFDYIIVLDRKHIE